MTFWKIVLACYVAIFVHDFIVLSLIRMKKERDRNAETRKNLKETEAMIAALKTEDKNQKERDRVIGFKQERFGL